MHTDVDRQLYLYQHSNKSICSLVYFFWICPCNTEGLHRLKPRKVESRGQRWLRGQEELSAPWHQAPPWFLMLKHNLWPKCDTPPCKKFLKNKNLFQLVQLELMQACCPISSPHCNILSLKCLFFQHNYFQAIYCLAGWHNGFIYDAGAKKDLV